MKPRLRTIAFCCLAILLVLVGWIITPWLVSEIPHEVVVSSFAQTQNRLPDAKRSDYWRPKSGAPAKVVDPSQQDSELYEAVGDADRARIELLLEKGANPNSQCFGESPLGFASRLAADSDTYEGRSTRVDEVMGEMNESLYRPSPKDWASIRDLLLERGAEETLETASIAGNVTFIQNAIAIHKPESSIELREALLVAARYGQVGVVKKLVDAGVPTRIRSYSGAPLLSLAAAHPQVLKVLLDADPELLHGRLNWPAISYMGVRFPNEGATPLHFAAAYGSIESTQLLLDHGADLNAVDECGVTPFLVACSVAQKDQIELLARLGAVVHPKRAWEMLGSISGGRQQEAEAGLQLEKLGIAKPT